MLCVQVLWTPSIALNDVSLAQLRACGSLQPICHRADRNQKGFKQEWEFPPSETARFTLFLRHRYYVLQISFNTGNSIFLVNEGGVTAYLGNFVLPIANVIMKRDD